MNIFKVKVSSLSIDCSTFRWKIRNETPPSKKESAVFPMKWKISWKTKTKKKGWQCNYVMKRGGASFLRHWTMIGSRDENSIFSRLSSNWWLAHRTAFCTASPVNANKWAPTWSQHLREVCWNNFIIPGSELHAISIRPGIDDEPRLAHSTFVLLLRGVCGALHETGTIARNQ